MPYQITETLIWEDGTTFQAKRRSFKSLEKAIEFIMYHKNNGVLQSGFVTYKPTKEVVWSI